MRAKKRRRVKVRRLKKAPAPAAAAPSDLKALNRGLLGAAAAGAARTRDASVEDPLDDWPETTGEEDRWILERGRKER